MTHAPDADRLRAVQDQLDILSEDVESRPREVLEAIPSLLDELEAWPQRDAYLWCLHLACQAFRFTDQLDVAVRTAELALDVAAAGSGLAAGFHLEAGMALNQKGEQAAAEPHLATAATAYRELDDPVGLAWALVAEGDALCGLARQDEALHLITEAEEAARSGGDYRAQMRASKQRAVVQRQRGDLVDAVQAIEIAIDGTQGHARANALLERGHIFTMSQAYAAATDDYVAANIEYAAHDDVLGLANTERALATIDLLLGREESGLEHLDTAALLYQRLGNQSGLGYTLRERSVVRLNRGAHAGADEDAVAAVGLFETTGDLLGLSGAWRSVARVASVLADPDRVAGALVEAAEAARRADNPLADAGVHLMRAELGDIAECEEAAAQAMGLYDSLDVPIGSAHAAVFAARSALEASTPRSLDYLRMAMARLRRARRRVVDPGRRADHDLVLRSIPTGVVEIAVGIGTKESSDLAAGAILESFPLGIRLAHRHKETEHVPDLVRKGVQLRAAGDELALRSVLRRLAAAVATLGPDIDDDECSVSVETLRSAVPEAAVLLIGPPTPGGHVPLAYFLPGGLVVIRLSELNADDVDEIDELGRIVDMHQYDVLWRPDVTKWQEDLSEVFLPPELREWLMRETPAELVLLVHPTLAHVPFESLTVAPGMPLGVVAAVRRLLAPEPTAELARCEHLTAFFDPALDWSPEQSVVGRGVSSVAEWLEEVGPNTLAVFGAHGDPSAAFDGWLRTTDRTQGFTAADLLNASLDGSVIILEACWAGRHLGHQTGETLNMTTAALLAGAAGVISGLWALPADPECTGRLVADALESIRRGTGAAEALRRARERVLAHGDETVQVPGGEARMQLSAPWAWAGLCSYG